MPENEMTTRPIAIRGWIVFYASMLHLTWAFSLFFSPDALAVAPINKVAEWLRFNQYAAAVTYLVAGGLAWWGSKRHKFDIIGLIAGLPQLLLILLGMEACIEIMIEGVHPNGMVDKHWYFLAQLASSLWLAPVYMLAVYLPYWRAMWRQRRR